MIYHSYIETVFQGVKSVILDLVFVCVCVCGERERERESRWWIGLNAKATEKDPRAFICVVYM